jgi:hypothetical protein
MLEERDYEGTTDGVRAAGGWRRAVIHKSPDRGTIRADRSTTCPPDGILAKDRVAAGEKLDRTASPFLPPASFVHLPAGMAHYAWVETETVVQINGVGPFDVTYVDPKNDPRNK